jgi:hypothetical protein
MRLVFVASLLLMLAGCDDWAFLEPAYYSPSFEPGEEAAQGVDMPFLLRGNPFAVPEAEFDRDVTDVMDGWAFGVPLHFAVAGDPNAAYRVVMIFNPPSSADGNALCQRPMTVQAIATSEPPPRQPLVVALCRGDSPLSYVSGSIEIAGGPRSAAFRDGIRAFIHSIRELPSSHTGDT